MYADVEVAGVPARSGRINFRLSGAWRAELDLGNTDDKSGRVDVRIAGRVFVGTVLTWAKDPAGDTRVVVIGGAGGLMQAISARCYEKTPLRLVVEDILRDAGETIDESSDPMPDLPRHYVRVAGPVSVSLRSVIAEDVHFRPLANGNMFVGKETWPELTTANEPAAYLDTKKRFEFSVVAADVLPGVVYMGQKITEVDYMLTEKALTASASYDEGLGGMLEQFDGLIKRRTQTSLRNCTTFAYLVASQNPDYTLNLEAEGLPDLPKVPMALSGFSDMKVLRGSTAYVVFENATSTNPTVIGLSMGAVQSYGTRASSISHEATSISQTAASIKLDAPDIQAGGTKLLVTFDGLLAVWSQLQIAGAGIGLSVPPLTPLAATTKLKGG